jgi:hypothetical protein
MAIVFSNHLFSEILLFKLLFDCMQMKNRIDTIFKTIPPSLYHSNTNWKTTLRAINCIDTKGQMRAMATNRISMNA